MERPTPRVSRLNKGMGRKESQRRLALLLGKWKKSNCSYLGEVCGRFWRKTASSFLAMLNLWSPLNSQ